MLTVANWKQTNTQQLLEVLVRLLSSAFAAVQLWFSVFLSLLIAKNISDSKKLNNDQELIQSDPISCPQNQKGNN